MKECSCLLEQSCPVAQRAEFPSEPQAGDGGSGERGFAFVQTKGCRQHLYPAYLDEEAVIKQTVLRLLTVYPPPQGGQTEGLLLSSSSLRVVTPLRLVASPQ